MDELYSARDIKGLIKEMPKIYRDVMRSHIDAYLDTHPLLVVDDPDSGKVIAVSLKGSPPRDHQVRGLERSVVNFNRRIMPFNDQQYYILMGDESDLSFPLSSSNSRDILPMAMIQHYVSHYQLDYGGIPPSGYKLADVMGQALGDKIRDAYPTGMRPRNVEALLMTNPLRKNRLAHEEHADIKIYTLRHIEEGDEVVVEGLISSATVPAHFCHKEAIWEEYLHNIEILFGKSSPKKKQSIQKKQSGSIEQKITAAIASIIASSQVQFADHSVIDAVTIPFERPLGNKSRARYDPEYIKPLYEQAVKLLNG